MKRAASSGIPPALTPVLDTAAGLISSHRKRSGVQKGILGPSRSGNACEARVVHPRHGCHGVGGDAECAVKPQLEAETDPTRCETVDLQELSLLLTVCEGLGAITPQI